MTGGGFTYAAAQSADTLDAAIVLQDNTLHNTQSNLGIRLSQALSRFRGGDTAMRSRKFFGVSSCLHHDLIPSRSPRQGLQVKSLRTGNHYCMTLPKLGRTGW
jgi:hypothetical protein